MKTVKNVLVTGATGFLGTKVCFELYKRGYNISALVRKSSDRSAIENYVNDYIISDLFKEENVNYIINNIKPEKLSIISLAGSVNYNHSYEESKPANVETAKNIADIAIRLQKEKRLNRLIFISSAAARGFPEKRTRQKTLISESVSFYKKGLSAYCDVKNEAENIVKRAILENNLNAVIIEPGSLVGKSSGSRGTTNTGLIKKIINGFPVLRGGASYTSAANAVHGIISALESGINGETYLLGGENLTMKEFALLVRKVYKKKYNDPHLRIPLFSIPKWISLLLAKKNIILNKQQALLGNAFHYIDHSKAERDLKYAHSAEDIESAVIDTIDELLNKI